MPNDTARGPDELTMAHAAYVVVVAGGLVAAVVLGLTGHVCVAGVALLVTMAIAIEWPGEGHVDVDETDE